MYLIDVNVLIRAGRDYYPIERVPQYWEWLSGQISSQKIATVAEVWREFKVSSKSPLFNWHSEISNSIQILDTGYLSRIGEVLSFGYAENLRTDEIASIGADCYLIAAAMHLNATVVTKEVSKKSHMRGLRRIPDACEALNVACVHDFRMLRELDFKIP